MSKGGYDYQFIDPGPTDDQKCPICHLVVRDAHQVTCCGKLFCYSCLTQHLKNFFDFYSSSCPLCREKINNNYFKDTKSNREIQGLKVYCSNKDSGCGWNGELRQVGTHMKGCGYQEWTCEDCGDIMLVLQRDQHSIEECIMRETECVLCNKEGTYQYISSPEHLEVCPGVEVECPNSGCSQVVKRCELLAHRNTCLKEEIKCPFHTMGCNLFEGKREELGSHIESSIGTHMELMAVKVTNLSNGVAQQMQPSFEGASVTLKMNQFDYFKSNSKQWCSNGFYTGPGGYRVRLCVYPNGSGGRKSTHVSVYINLMPGENDDVLEFPMRGEFHIELLNQIEDNYHCDATLTFDKSNIKDCFMRKNKIDTSGWGWPRFIENSLLVDESKSIRYLAKDMMYFRVTAAIHSTTKPWLVETVQN